MHYGGDGRRSKSLWAHEPILTPERKLWRAVLEQAYLDSELPRSIAPGRADICAPTAALKRQISNLFAILRMCPRTASFYGRGSGIRSPLEEKT